MQAAGRSSQYTLGSSLTYICPRPSSPLPLPEPPGLAAKSPSVQKHRPGQARTCFSVSVAGILVSSQCTGNDSGYSEQPPKPPPRGFASSAWRQMTRFPSQWATYQVFLQPMFIFLGTGNVKWQDIIIVARTVPGDKISFMNVYEENIQFPPVY